jgi:fluoride ion exporter CrcB/FEX
MLLFVFVIVEKPLVASFWEVHRNFNTPFGTLFFSVIKGFLINFSVLWDILWLSRTQLNGILKSYSTFATSVYNLFLYLTHPFDNLLG